VNGRTTSRALPAPPFINDLLWIDLQQWWHERSFVRKEIPVSEKRPPKPRVVGIAVTLLYIAFLFYILQLLADLYIRAEPISERIILSMAEAFIIRLLMIDFIASGERGVRYFSLVVFIFDWLSPWYIQGGHFSKTPVLLLPLIVQILIQMVAFVLLFRRDSNTWFQWKWQREPKGESAVEANKAPYVWRTFDDSETVEGR
jgi:hypothetical protein